MVRNYVRKTNRGCGGTWTREAMLSAVEAVQNGLSIAKAAAQFGLPKTTLILKTKGWKGRKSTLESVCGGRMATISTDKEKELSDMLKTMSKWGFGLGKEQVVNVVQDYVVAHNIKNSFKNNRPGRNWFSAFCKRNNLSLKKPELLESARARQSNDPFVVYDFCEKVSQVIMELGLEQRPECIYNCDESGFRSDPTTSKIVTAKGLPAKRVTGGNARKTTTVLACVSAAGEKLPPFILHKGKRLWNSMIGENAFPGTSYSVSENGWMTEEAFFNWFQNQFLNSVKERPVLLIYDGHLSHVGLDLIKCAIASQVTILKLPPHTSHILQPLDVTVFRGVKCKWDTMLTEWARHNYGKLLPKSVFANIFGKTWSAVSPDIIKKGFEKCGIFNPTLDFPVNFRAMAESNFDPAKLRRYKEMYPLHIQIENNLEISTNGSKNQYNIASRKDTNGTQSGTSQSLGFEELLLKTVSPQATDGKVAKKRRIDNAEVITRESYLKKLEEDASEKLKMKPKAKKQRTQGRKAKGNAAAKENKPPRVKARDKRCLF